jgi:hypothetical protein
MILKFWQSNKTQQGILLELIAKFDTDFTFSEIQKNERSPLFLDIAGSFLILCACKNMVLDGSSFIINDLGHQQQDVVAYEFLAFIAGEIHRDLSLRDPRNKSTHDMSEVEYEDYESRDGKTSAEEFLRSLHFTSALINKKTRWEIDEDIFAEKAVLYYGMQGAAERLLNTIASIGNHTNPAKMYQSSTRSPTAGIMTLKILPNISAFVHQMPKIYADAFDKLLLGAAKTNI